MTHNITNTKNFSSTKTTTTKIDNATVKREEMKNSPLHKFFVNALKDIYYAENAILEALEKMQDAATTEELKDAFEDHHLQTQKHVKRLEKVFQLIDEKPEKKECKAIKGIIEEEKKSSNPQKKEPPQGMQHSLLLPKR